MRQFLLLAMLAVCLSTLSQPKVNITVKTDKEQHFFFYGAGSFVVGEPYEECEEPWMRLDHIFSFDGNTLTIDNKAFKVIKHTYRSGPVFKDAGKQEIYLITVKKSDNDYETTISISKVTDGNKSKWIINMPSYDQNGVLTSLQICTD